MAFKQGKSGNPKGRPSGTGVRQKIFNSLVEPHKESLFNTAITLALEGNEAMLRLFLERMLPVKPLDEPIIAATNVNGTLSEQGKEVLFLIVTGQITPSEGTALLHAISSQAKLIETDELDRRLKTLEEKHHEKFRKPNN